jgi:hypothetical protein
MHTMTQIFSTGDRRYVPLFADGFQEEASRDRKRFFENFARSESVGAGGRYYLASDLPLLKGD